MVCIKLVEPLSSDFQLHASTNSSKKPFLIIWLVKFRVVRRIARISEGRWIFCLIGLLQHNSLYTYFQRLPTNAQLVYVVWITVVILQFTGKLFRTVCVCVMESGKLWKLGFFRNAWNMFSTETTNNFITLLTLNENILRVVEKLEKRSGRRVYFGKQQWEKGVTVTTGRFFSNIQWPMRPWFQMVVLLLCLSWLHQVAEVLEHQIFQQTWKVCFPFSPPLKLALECFRWVQESGLEVVDLNVSERKSLIDSFFCIECS